MWEHLGALTTVRARQFCTKQYRKKYTQKRQTTQNTGNKTTVVQSPLTTLGHNGQNGCNTALTFVLLCFRHLCREEISSAISQRFAIDCRGLAEGLSRKASDDCCWCSCFYQFNEWTRSLKKIKPDKFFMASHLRTTGCHQIRCHTILLAARHKRA